MPNTIFARPNSGDGPKEVTGRTVFVCLVAFFAVVAAVNGVMIRAAVSTFGGVETANSYQAGLTFAREIAAAEAQDSLHWQVQASVSATGAGETLIEIVAADENGRPLTGLAATALLAHPTDRRADHAVALTERAAGRYQGRTGQVAGQWMLVTELSRGERRMFRSRNRIVLR
jgi:nitrogen fixation protein FixH